MDIAGTVASAMGQRLGSEEAVDIDPVVPPKIKRLVKWNAEMLLRILKQVVARRDAIESLTNEEGSERPDLASSTFSSSSRSVIKRTSSIDGRTCMDEVKEIIQLPKFNTRAAKIQKDASQVVLDPKVSQQLHDYITVIASMYRADVPFHNCKFSSGILNRHNFYASS